MHPFKHCTLYGLNKPISHREALLTCQRDVGKIEIGIYVVGAADELIRVDHFLPEDISVRYQVV